MTHLDGRPRYSHPCHGLRRGQMVEGAMPERSTLSRPTRTGQKKNLQGAGKGFQEADQHFCSPEPHLRGREKQFLTPKPFSEPPLGVHPYKNLPPQAWLMGNLHTYVILACLSNNRQQLLWAVLSLLPVLTQPTAQQSSPVTPPVVGSPSCLKYLPTYLLCITGLRKPWPPAKLEPAGPEPARSPGRH